MYFDPTQMVFVQFVWKITNLHLHEVIVHYIKDKSWLKIYTQLFVISLDAKAKHVSQVQED